jgi:hypothetical protein
MSQDIRSGLLFECETELQGDDVSWEDDQGFGLTDTDLQVMTTIGWTPEDLTIEKDQTRYRQYLAKKQ